ncbi:MAG: hypothetical protein RJB39_767 [Candidatus Parcubacteria bacterium]|jgi:hypothetical protein
MRLFQLFIPSDESGEPPILVPYLQLKDTGGKNGGKRRCYVQDSILSLKVADDYIDLVPAHGQLTEGLISQRTDIAGQPWLICRDRQPISGMMQVLVQRYWKNEVASDGNGIRRLITELGGKDNRCSQLWLIASGTRLTFRMKDLGYQVVNDDGIAVLEMCLLDDLATDLPVSVLPREERGNGKSKDGGRRHQHRQPPPLDGGILAGAFPGLFGSS